MTNKKQLKFKVSTVRDNKPFLRAIGGKVWTVIGKKGKEVVAQSEGGSTRFLTSSTMVYSAI